MEHMGYAILYINTRGTGMDGFNRGSPMAEWQFAQAIGPCMHGQCLRRSAMSLCCFTLRNLGCKKLGKGKHGKTDEKNETLAVWSAEVSLYEHFDKYTLLSSRLMPPEFICRHEASLGGQFCMFFC